MKRALIFGLFFVLGASSAFAKKAIVTSAPAEIKITSAPQAIREVLKKDGRTVGKGSMKDNEKLITAKEIAGIAQMQLQKLTAYAIDTIKPQLLKTGSFTPVGAMVYRDGRVNHIVIKNKMPVTDKIKLYRLALRSLARHNKIDASVIIFSAELKKGSKSKLIVMNYEHRFGVSGTRVIGYQLAKGKLKMAPPKDLPKNFFVFFDENKLKSKSRTSGNKL